MGEQYFDPVADEKMARRCAYILGEMSGAARAVKDLDDRRARGERAVIEYFKRGAMWLVGVPRETK
jgi:hypothetical protein